MVIVRSLPILVDAPKRWSSKNPEETKCADQQQYGRDRHGDRPHGTVSVIWSFKSLQNSGVLNDRSYQGQHAKDDKAASEDQGAADRVGGSAQSHRLQILITFTDPEPEPDQRERCANPRHQGSVRSQAVTLLGQLRGRAAA